ncbi:MAG: luciferase family protein, partial [Chloroflexia bacterium]
MQAELLAEIERELLSWPGVGKESGSGGPGRGGFWVSPFTSYTLGRKELGHIHQEIGVADLTFTREIHDRLVSEGRATAHAAALQGVVSYEVRSEEDVAKA